VLELSGPVTLLHASFLQPLGGVPFDFHPASLARPSEYSDACILLRELGARLTPSCMSQSVQATPRSGPSAPIVQCNRSLGDLSSPSRGIFHRPCGWFPRGSWIAQGVRRGTRSALALRWRGSGCTQTL